MSQKKTLNQKQLNAIELLLSGMSVTDSAKEVKTARETVSRWLNQDSEFIAEINQRRHNMWHSSEDRLRSLLPKALDVLETELENGDKQTALSVIRLASVKVEPVGETSASAIDMAKSLEWI